MGRGARISWIALASLFALTGCVAGATGPSPTEPHGFTTTTTVATTTTTVTMEQGLERYRSCLDEQGVSIGEIPRDGLGRPRMAAALSGLDLDERVVLDALETCGPHLATGALDLQADPELRALVQASLDRFARCVRSRGVADYPDPVAGFDGIGSPFPVNRVPWTDPDLPSAVTACTSHLETGG